MKNLYFILFLVTSFSFGQVTFNGNANTGFGGAVGSGSFSINDNGTTVTVTFTRGGGLFGDTMVMYIDNGSAGRNVIDGNVNDTSDPNRRAISNVGSGNLTFPTGFEATHVVAINTGFGGLWSIPATGSIGNNGLNFVDAVGTPSNNFTTFDFVFDWSEIGLTSTDNFSFVVTYGNPNDTGNTIMFSSNEAFGGGVTGGNPGSGAFSYTTYFDYPSGDIGGLAASATGGNWSNPTTWVNNNVPLSGDDVVINPGHNVFFDQDAEVSFITTSSGPTGRLIFLAGQRTLSIRDGGSFVNNGSFGASDGKVSFLGSGSVSGNLTTFRNVDIKGGVNFGTNSTIGGELTIETGGSLDTNLVRYTANSTLIYSDDGNIYGRSLEWSTTSGPGYPSNVIIKDGTTLNLGANSGTGTARECAGNLTVEAGSALTLAGPDMTQPLTVLGDFLNNGTVTLSGAVGGDLVLEGNFDDNGTFNSNNRAVFFQGENSQTVNSTTPALPSDPSITIDFIIIDKTPSNNVQLLSNLVLPNNLEMANGNLDLNGNTLTISGDIRPSSGAGAIIANAPGSTIIFDDTSTARTIESGDIDSNEIANLTIDESGGVSINTDLKVTGTMDFNAGENAIGSDYVLDINGATLDVASAAGFTFESDWDSVNSKTRSAQLDNASGASVTGDVTVERFIPAGENNRRAYRMLTSSVTSTGSINASWQEGAVTTAPGNGNPNSGFGTHITGGTVADGFDQNETGAESMFTFDNTNTNGTAAQNDDWSAIPNTDVLNLEAGKPYLTFIRGDRGIDVTSNSAPPTNTTLRATGQLVIGIQTSQVLSNQPEFFSLLGNPYQAIVDFNDITFTGDVNTNFLYVWDANANTRGAYETVSVTTSPSSPDQMIQPGQSFFVQNSATVNTAPTVEFTETAKETSGNVTTVFSNEQIARANLGLYNSNNLKLDVLQLSFEDNANNGLDDFDAGKLGNPDENLSSWSNNTLLSAERRATPQNNDLIQLNTIGYRFTNYEFRLGTADWNPAIEVFVADNYLNTTTPIDAQNPFYFSVDTNIPESIAADRFSLIFDNTTLGVDENTFGSDFSVFPNPATNGQFSINTPNLSGDVNVKITSLLGQNVYSQDLVVIGNQVDVNAQNLSTGIYVVKLTQGNQSFSAKVIVE